MTEQTASSVQLNSEKFIRDEPSLTNAELEFIRIFVNYTRNKVLDAAGIRRKPEFPSGPVLEQLNYLSDMYHRPENLQAIEEGLLIIYKKFISNCFPNPPVDRTLDFQTLQSLLEMSLYYQGTKHRSFSFDIRDFQELDELIKNLLESYQWALIKVYDLDSCNLSRIESFQKFLKSFCANYIEETIKSFDRDCSLLEKNKQPMTSDQDLDEFDNRINSVLEKLRGCQNQRFSEKDKEELSRYLEKGLKFKGLYGKGEPFQCSSGESITAEEFQKQFKSLSESKDSTIQGALKIKALAYSDFYKKHLKDYAMDLGFICDKTPTSTIDNYVKGAKNINLKKHLIPALIKQFRQSN